MATVYPEDGHKQYDDIFQQTYKTNQPYPLQPAK
jgi:hypothetical protein